MYFFLLYHFIFKLEDSILLRGMLGTPFDFQCKLIVLGFAMEVSCMHWKTIRDQNSNPFCMYLVYVVWPNLHRKSVRLHIILLHCKCCSVHFFNCYIQIVFSLFWCLQCCPKRQKNLKSKFENMAFFKYICSIA